MIADIPVLLVIFNRPDKTKLVTDALRKVKPTRLFVAADGPRRDRPEDIKKCLQSREIALDIDWKCEIQTRFLDINVGCGPGVSSAISWFFEEVEHGVILEDDCVPHPDFFLFCGELLERYACDERVMNICGFAPASVRNYRYDYHFSRRFRCFGWATWRRAWKHFSYAIDIIPEDEILEMFKAYYPFHYHRRPWLKNYKRVMSGDLKTWAFRWEVACFAQNGLNIVPEINLIQNIGFDKEATHTNKNEPLISNLEMHALAFPLKHPEYVYADSRPELDFSKKLYKTFPIKWKLSQKIHHLIGQWSDYFKTMP